MSLRHVKYNGLKPEIRARTQSGCLVGGGDDGGVLVAFQERHLSVLEIHLFYLLVLLTSYVRKRGTALKGSEEFFRSYYLKRKVESRCLYTSMNLVSRQSISYLQNTGTNNRCNYPPTEESPRNVLLVDYTVGPNVPPRHRMPLRYQVR